MNTSDTKALPFYLESISRKLVKLPITVISEGLQFHPDATDAEREKIFRGIKKLNKDVTLWLQFALGDAYNALPGDYGTKTKWVEDNFGGKEAVMQIKKCAGAAKRWPHAQRRMNFPWSFYLETAVDKFGINDREKMAEDYQAGKLTIEGIREIKREMDGGKTVIFDELDQEYWPPKLKNALRVLIQQNGVEKAAELLDDLVISEQNSPAFISENGNAENAENNAIFDDSPSKQRTDVGTLFANKDPLENAFSNNPAEDNPEAWEQHPPKPLPRPSLAEQPQSEKSDNKKTPYCRIEPLATALAAEEPSTATREPAMITFDALVAMLAGLGIDFARGGEAGGCSLVLTPPPDMTIPLDIAQFAAWHEAALLKLADLNAEMTEIDKRIERLKTGEPPKGTRAYAMEWVRGQIDVLAEQSIAFGGTVRGWPDAGDPFADSMDQIDALRAHFSALNA